LSLFNELKRRNVFRVGIAYAVAAWVLLQVADLVLESTNAPSWVLQAMMLVVALGFIASIIIAWAYELTPEGIKRERDVIHGDSVTHETGRKLNQISMGFLVVAVVFFAIDKYMLNAGHRPDPAKQAVMEPVPSGNRETATGSVKTEPPPESVGKRPSIAVLPFVNMSDDKDYFADGLSEEILNLLAKNRALKVIGRTSSFVFKGKTEDLREIGKTLGVSTVLEGSVRKAGNTIRITAQLIEVAEGSHLWSETYDRELTDVFAIQDEVAAAIFDALQLHLGDTAVATRVRPTDNMLAYEKFLTAKAQALSGQGTRALESLQDVVALDPTFAEAWEALSAEYWFSNLPVIDAMAGCFSSATRARELDPTRVLAVALAVSCDTENWSWSREITALETAVQQLPDETQALFPLIFDYVEAGYAAEALLLTERLVVIEPLAAASHNNHGGALRAVGRVDEARTAWQRSVELGGALSAQSLFMDYMISGEIDAAIVALERFLRMSGEDPTGIGDRIRAAADPVSGRQALLDWVATFPESDFWNGTNWLYFLAFRQFDDLFDVIDAHNARATDWSDADNIMFYVAIFRNSGVTANPRYAAAMNAIGAVDAWETHGPPDHCRKDTGAWVCQ